MKNCSTCKRPIPKERIECLSDTTVCVNCSEVVPLLGIMVWDKKTPRLAIVHQDEAEAYWNYENFDGRLARV